MEGNGILTNPTGESTEKIFKKNFVQLDKVDGIFGWPFLND